MSENLKDKQTISIRGDITARFYRPTGPLAARWNRQVEKFIKRLPRLRGWAIRNLMSLELAHVDEHKNIICHAGLSRVTAAISGDLGAVDIKINKMELGTGSGSLSTARTALFTPNYRNDTGSFASANNIAYLTAYFTQTEVTGTFTEFGNYISGNATLGNGYLWSHIASLNWVKDNVTILVVDCKYTFTSV